MTLEAFCDDFNEYSWFISLDNRLKNADFKKIGTRGNNPPSIEKLIAYDRPDIILVKNGRAVLAIEKTREVPTGHNVGQRMARLIRSVELNVPVIMFTPFDARKHGKYSSICNINARVLLAFEKIWEIHSTPIFAINWPSDSFGELVEDETADQVIKEVISEYITTNFDPCCQAFQNARVRQLQEYKQRLSMHKPYGHPPGSVQITPTEIAVSSFGLDISSPAVAQLLTTPETVIYKIAMSEEKCRREDPYTGTQFMYDYLYCRNGPLRQNKSRNLLLYFPKIRKSVFTSNNPNDTNRKSSNWYLTATAHIFKDGLTFLQ
jgi:hypothetical protein